MDCSSSDKSKKAESAAPEVKQYTDCWGVPLGAHSTGKVDSAAPEGWRWSGPSGKGNGPRPGARRVGRHDKQAKADEREVKLTRRERQIAMLETAGAWRDSHGKMGVQTRWDTGSETLGFNGFRL